MEALLDFFDPTEEVDQPSTSPKAHQDPLPSSLPPEVRTIFQILYNCPLAPKMCFCLETKIIMVPLCVLIQVEVGNVEYKLKLLNPTASRFEHLVTQMKWRLREGQGEAIYEIGVADSGMLTGLTESEMDDSIDTLRKMAER